MSNNVVESGLVDVLIGDGFHVAIGAGSELVVGPEGIVEGEVMGLFVFLFVLVEDCGVLSHFYATDASQEVLSLIEGTHANCHFDAHLCYFFIYYWDGI